MSISAVMAAIKRSEEEPKTVFYLLFGREVMLKVGK